MRYRTIVLVAFVLSLFAFAAATPRSGSGRAIQSSEQPRNGDLQSAVAEAARESDGPAWVVYEVAGVNPNFYRCCSCGGMPEACRLDGEGNHSMFQTDDDEEGGSGSIRVALRVADGAVNRLDFFSGDCELESGDEPATQLAGIGEAESVAFLVRFIEGDTEEHNVRPKRSTVLAAVAAHAGGAADDALERFTASDRPAKLRKQAAFWLGAARGGRGFEFLKRLAGEDKDPEFRKQIVFAIHVSKEPQAVDELVRMAREDGSRRVRKQALFWLGQRAGKKAVAALEQAVEDDPDTEIQKSALFALSQLPEEEGTPLLMKIARTHANPKIRKQAFFWLGQSDDPRALEFFEQVLSQ